MCAQNDEAFAKVLEADLDALLKDWAKLTAVLTYRLVPGKVMAANVKAGKVKTVQGSEIMVSASGGLMIDSAKVTATDIAADSGVIQVIDSVIMPKQGNPRRKKGPACGAFCRQSKVELAVRLLAAA